MKKIAILTNFKSFNPSYSLCSIVLDQAEMLYRKGHEVTIFVSHLNTENPFPSLPIKIERKIEVPKLIDYQSKKDLIPFHLSFISEFSKKLLRYIKNFDIIFTHDWIFTGWNLPYAACLMEIAEDTRDKQFYHWIHSIPSKHKDWWILDAYGVKNHHIVYPNGIDAQNVAIKFRAHISHVEPIPHIKDLRSWFNFGETSRMLIDKIPGLLQSTFVQIYPASTDRLTAKRVDRVIKIFGQLKKLGFSCNLLIVNQWATKRQKREEIKPLLLWAKRVGLNKDEIHFTSQFKEIENGVTKRTLRELFLCSNVFIYPTRDETFGLVGPEACLSGPKIVVLNGSLELMREVHGDLGAYENFGAFNVREPEDCNTAKTHKKIAQMIVDKFQSESSVALATYHRIKYNMDSIYQNFYKRIIERG